MKRKKLIIISLVSVIVVLLVAALLYTLFLPEIQKKTKDELSTTVASPIKFNK